MCEHISNLGPSYPGCYCIYCGQDIAQIESEEGQIVLKDLRGDRIRKYLAVIHKGQQKRVEEIVPGAPRSRIRFSDGGQEMELDTARVILAFQDSEEVLRLE
jgi:hypothetical protein